MKFSEHAEAAAKAIFEPDQYDDEGRAVAVMPSGLRIPVMLTPGKKVPHVVMTEFRPFPYTVRTAPQGPWEEITVRNVTFLAQNPRTGSSYAALARDGAQITWVMFNGYYSGMGVLNREFRKDIHAACRELGAQVAKERSRR